jgi:hypothetical protein
MGLTTKGLVQVARKTTSHRSDRLWPRRSRRSNMLSPMPPLIPVSPATSTVCLDKVARRPSQVMVSTQQLLVVLVVNQSLPPEMVEKAEIRS